MFQLRIGHGDGNKAGRQRQQEVWLGTATLARPAGRPFYERLNLLVDKCSFDDFVEHVYRPFYAVRIRRRRASTADLFPAAVAQILRGNRQRTMNRLASSRFAEHSRLYATQFRRNHPRSNDDHADAAVDRRGDASLGVRLGSDGAGGTRFITGKTIEIDATTLERTQRCEALCDGIPARAMKNSCAIWRRRPESKSRPDHNCAVGSQAAQEGI